MYFVDRRGNGVGTGGRSSMNGTKRVLELTIIEYTYVCAAAAAECTCIRYGWSFILSWFPNVGQLNLQGDLIFNDAFPLAPDTKNRYFFDHLATSILCSRIQALVIDFRWGGGPPSKWPRPRQIAGECPLSICLLLDHLWRKSLQLQVLRFPIGDRWYQRTNAPIRKTTMSSSLLHWNSFLLGGIK